MKKNLRRALAVDFEAIPLPIAAEAVRLAGRGGDTILAHITPREAKKLKAEGGSGRINPATGLPEFQEYYGGFEPDIGGGYSPEPVSSYQFEPTYNYEPTYTAVQQRGGYEPSTVLPPEQRVAPSYEPYTGFASQTLPARAFTEDFGPTYTQPERDFVTRAIDFLSRNKELVGTVGRLGTGALGAIPALRASSRARAEAARAREEQMALAAPYQRRGQAMVAAAERGELIPTSQQAIQAAQARLNQGVASRGGVGAQQAAVQIEALRAQLLQGQYDYGLKVMGIGDNIARGAIQAGLNADQEVMRATGDFFGQIGALVGGTNILSGSQRQSGG